MVKKKTVAAEKKVKKAAAKTPARPTKAKPAPAPKKAAAKAKPAAKPAKPQAKGSTKVTAKKAPAKAVSAKSAAPKAAKPAPKAPASKGKPAPPAKAVPAKASSKVPAPKASAPKPQVSKPSVSKPVAAKSAPAKSASPATPAKAVSSKPAVSTSPKVAAPKAETPKGTAPSAAAAAAAAKAVPDKRRILASKNKMLPRDFLFKLAEAIRTAILPIVQEAKGREIVGTALSGDATFELDKVAERALLQHLKIARAPVAYYSEDSGYSTFSSAQPKNLLVVDPIDGTRAAKSGFEGCVISIATTRIIERPVMADVDNALVMEILSGRTIYAERGAGTRIYAGGAVKKPKLSDNMDLESVAWSMTVPGRPAELIFPTAARFIDLTSLKGGFFACNSTAYSLTRLVTNQLDACVDFAGRYYRDIPELVKDYFLNAGRGNVLGVAPYDMVAGLLIAQEAGCKVTNAYGKGFDDVMLLDSSPNNHQTIIAAASPELWEKLYSFFDTRITQFENLLKRRAARE
ncbi:MAG: hypothetical protein RLZZ303_1596 [Candidatus Hydrogenedentota bacterium]